MIMVLSLLFAGAILPFVDYYNEAEYEGEDKDFKHFKRLATTNRYIFQSFANHFADNYLFKKNSKKNKRKTEFTVREFENL